MGFIQSFVRGFVRAFHSFEGGTATAAEPTTPSYPALVRTVASGDQGVGGVGVHVASPSSG